MGLIQFTRDGRYVVSVDGAALAIADVRDGVRRRVSTVPIRAVAAMQDEVWAVTADGALARFGVDGRPRGGGISLPCDDGAELIATTVGSVATLWTSAPPVGVADDLGTAVAVAPPADAVFPVAARRWVCARDGRITLPGGGVLAGLGTLAGGAAIFDGNAVLLVIDGTGGRAAVVAHGARVMQRTSIPVGMWRVAPRRGVLAVARDTDIELVDIRLGRRIAVIPVATTGDFAISPDGDAIARRLPDGTVDIASVTDLLARAAPVVVAMAGAGPMPEPGVELAAGSGSLARVLIDAAAEPIAESTADVLIEATAGQVIAGPVLRALEPRIPLPPIARDAARAILDCDMRRVALWTLLAIARAWDSRRIGYANEGKHPYEHEVAALVGMNHGFAGDYLAAVHAELAAHDAGAPTSHDTPLARLVTELGLSAAAVDILCVIAGPSLLGETARLYGILGNDAARALVDEALVQQILADRVSRHDVAAELEPTAPLVRFGIVAVDAGRARPFAGLAIDPVVLARLRGEPPLLGEAVALRDADRPLDALALARGVLDRALATLAPASRGPLRLAVRGRPGSGRRTLLAALAREANRRLAVVDATQLPRDADAFVRALRTALRRVQLAGAVPAIAGLDEVIFGDRTGADLARDVVRAHPGPISIIAPPTVAIPLPAGHLAIDLAPLSETERAEVWRRELGARWLRDPVGIAARYRVGPGTIARAVATCDAIAIDGPCDERVDAFMRQTRDVRLGEHARRVERLAAWSDVVLAPDIMDSLRELVGRVRHRRTVLEAWGMGRTLQTSRGLTALFQGLPGTGKTLVAGVIARELGLDLYQVDLSKVMSKWLGETERNLATIFDAAEDGQVILLFDEADSLFAKRTEVRSSNDRYANLEVNYLLQRLDAFEGIAILTTNAGGAIDPAFQRRMSFRLSFPFPDEDTREQLWRAHLPAELPRAGDLVFDALARKYQLSGGYIRNACLRAAFLAAQEETSLAQRHLERAVALEFAELGKLSTSGALE